MKTVFKRGSAMGIARMQPPLRSTQQILIADSSQAQNERRESRLSKACLECEAYRKEVDELKQRIIELEKKKIVT